MPIFLLLEYKASEAHYVLCFWSALAIFSIFATMSAVKAMQRSSLCGSASFISDGISLHEKISFSGFTSTFWSKLMLYSAVKSWFLFKNVRLVSVENVSQGSGQSDSSIPSKRYPRRTGNKSYILHILYAEWEKVWSRLRRTCSHFFRLLARILTIFDKEYRILTCCDKRESYLIVLQQNKIDIC